LVVIEMALVGTTIFMSGRVTLAAIVANVPSGEVAVFDALPVDCTAKW
jgi:hypothetical protein